MMGHIKTKGVKGVWTIVAVIVVSIAVAVLSMQAASARITDDEFEDIVNEEISKDNSIQSVSNAIEEKAASVRSLEERLDVYEENIKKHQQEQLTLKSQIALIEDKIDQTSVDIEKASLELEVLQLEVEALQGQIREAELDIEQQKESLGQLVADIYKFDNRTTLEITFGNSSFSDFYSEVEYTGRVQTSAQETLDKVQRIKKQLKGKRVEVQDKQSEVSSQRSDLEVQQDTLSGEQVYKEDLLTQTEESEEKFQELLSQVRSEQSQIEGQIATLERNVQAKISSIRSEVQKKLDDGSQEVTEEEEEILAGPSGFAWPISSRTVTCEFHCDGYPFARYFQHSGMDISTSMGSTVTASASGYVAIARFDGTANYAYVMIVHGDGLATVYGHLSGVDVVADQYVQQGEVIGVSGGLRGTPGAGSYSTGPHLHFEVRKDGIPVNPRNYL